MAKARACMCASKGRTNCPHHAHIDTIKEEQTMSIKVIKELTAGPKVLMAGDKVLGKKAAKQNLSEDKPPLKPAKDDKPPEDTKETKEEASKNAPDDPKEPETPSIAPDDSKEPETLLKKGKKGKKRKGKK